MDFESVYLFGDRSISKLTRKKSSYSHQLGGTSTTSVQNRNIDVPIHLLLSIDQSDPAVPFRFGNDDVLELFCCYDLRVTSFAYKPSGQNDSRSIDCFVEGDIAPQDAPEWPYHNYPSSYERVSLVSTPVPYDSSNLKDAYAFASVFGLNDLSVNNYIKSIKMANKDYMFATMGEAPSSVGELLDEIPHPFFQPIRRLCTKCVNPDCINTRGLLSLTPVCCCNSGAEFMGGVFHNGEGSSENIQLAFLACPLCDTIHVFEFWES